MALLPLVARGIHGGASAPKEAERPQSTTQISPKRPSITFSGFRSRWSTPR